MLECNVCKCERIRPLEVKCFIIPYYSSSRAVIVQASPQHLTFGPTEPRSTSLRVRRIFIQASTAAQCLALIQQLILKVKKNLLAADWFVEMEWKHLHSFHVISKADIRGNNIFWLLLIWPRPKWMTSKAGEQKKKKPTTYFIPDFLYLILLAIHISTWIKFKHNYQMNDWLPFIILDVITSTVLSVWTCHNISKGYFRDWRCCCFPSCKAVTQITGCEKWHPDKPGRATPTPYC